MPTGRCNYPHHHGGPSAGPPASLVAAILAGALIIANWGTVLVVLAVAVVLAAALTVVVMLFHAHTSAPYDSGWDDQSAGRHQALSGSAAQTGAVPAGDRTAALTAEVAALRAQIAAAPAQQHLHLHGVPSGEIAAVLRQAGHQAAELEGPGS